MIVVQIESALRTIWEAYKNRQLAAQNVGELKTDNCQYFYKNSDKRCAIGQLIPFWYKNLIIHNNINSAIVSVLCGLDDSYNVHKKILSIPSKFLPELTAIQKIHDEWMREEGLMYEKHEHLSHHHPQNMESILKQTAEKYGITLE